MENQFEACSSITTESQHRFEQTDVATDLLGELRCFDITLSKTLFTEPSHKSFGDTTASRYSDNVR